MNANDTDPVKRWRSISDWYAEFAAEPNWEFLAPMVELATWVSEQPFAATLFPSTSHASLCVQLHTGYRPDLPFFSCGVRVDGQFECDLWGAVARRQERRMVSFDQAQAVFAEFVTLLNDMADQKAIRAVGLRNAAGQMGAEP